MSGSDDDENHESGGDNDLSKEADKKRLLFVMKGSKKSEYWSFINESHQKTQKRYGKAVKVLWAILYEMQIAFEICDI